MRALLLTLALATPAQASDWFAHEFGELRAYYGDWLAVCEDLGDGPCRMVQSVIPEGGDTFFGTSRLAVHPDRDGGFRIEVFDRDMEADRVNRVIFDFGLVLVQVYEDRFATGSGDGVNVAETLSVLDPLDAGYLARLIAAEQGLTVAYFDATEFLGSATFSLRGSAAALLAVETKLAEQ